MTLLYSATLVVLFEAQVQQTPDRVALIEGDRQFTYQELNAQANQLAHALKQCEWADHTNLVAIALDRSCEFVIAVLGVLKAGFAYIPLDRSLPKNRILDILSEARSPLLTTQAFADNLELPVASFYFDRAQSSILCQSTANPLSRVQPSDLAYVIYTSGSTGVPKGVMIEHRSATHYAVTAAQAYGLTAIDRVLQCCSLSFDAVIEELFCTFASGAILVIRSEDMLSTAAFFLSECQRLQITALFVPTALWHFLAAAVVEEALELPKTLRLISMGGERARPELFQRWRDRVGNSIRLINGYGPTEATVVATMSDLSQIEAIEGELPIGVPIEGVEAYILDANLNLVAPLQVGELYLGGAGIARGYLSQPQLTQERFILSPFDSRVRLYRTGDRVRMRSDQQLEYVGRIDHQVKVAGGFRVELFEVEAQITRHPSIDQAVVIAIDQGQGKKCLIAYVVFSAVFQEAVAVAELRSFLKQQLPIYMIPMRFVPLDSLPLSPIGKVDRQKLAALFVATEVEPSTRSNNSIAAQIADIFQALLHQSIGLEDNFFDWGGTSLLAAQALAKITRTWQVSVWMRQFYQSPTPAALAQIVIGAQQGYGSLDDSIDFEAEARFSLEVDRTKPTLSLEAAQTILLTGATGFLGAFLLYKLLQTTAATIVCLVRCRDAAAGQARLQSILTQYHLWNPADRDRIHILPGDLAQPRLGLSEAEFLQLADRVEAVYHSGAIVDFVKPYSLLKAANVGGTAEILRLVCSGQAIKPLMYISTIGVFGAAGYFIDETVIHEQTPLSISQPFIKLDDGYAQSKWVAERMVQQAQQQKLPIAIVRPGFIVGHSQTGAANPKDYISRLIKGCIELGCVPQLIGQKDQMVTVDYVASAIVHFFRSSQHIGKIFHLTPPLGCDLTTQQLYDLLGKFGYSLDSVSYSEWAQLLASSPANPLYPLLPLFSEPVHQGKSLIELYQHCPDYDCGTTQAALASIEITFSSIEPILLETYLPAWIRSGFLIPPNQSVELPTLQPRLLTSATPHVL